MMTGKGRYLTPDLSLIVCQYPRSALRVENMFRTPRKSIHIAILESGKEALLVTALSFVHFT